MKNLGNIWIGMTMVVSLGASQAAWADLHCASPQSRATETRGAGGATAISLDYEDAEAGSLPRLLGGAEGSRRFQIRLTFSPADCRVSGARPELFNCGAEGGASVTLTDLDEKSATRAVPAKLVFVSSASTQSSDNWGEDLRDFRTYETFDLKILIDGHEAHLGFDPQSCKVGSDAGSVRLLGAKVPKTRSQKRVETPKPAVSSAKW